MDDREAAHEQRERMARAIYQERRIAELTNENIRLRERLVSAEAVIEALTKIDATAGKWTPP